MMQTDNFQLLTNSSMGATVASDAIYLPRFWGGSIQAVWTGSPVGNFTIEVSNDPGKDPVNTIALGTGVVNWTTYIGSSSAAGGVAGDLMYNITDIAFKWARLKYTRTSGSGTLNARVNCKGV